MKSRKLGTAALGQRAKRIRCLFLDIDGVMTDCKLYLTPDGEELKAVNVKDGYGIKALMQAGIEVAVISGRPSRAMEKRMAYLGVRHVFLDTPEKIPAYEAVCRTLNLRDDQCAHMGDDVPDLPLFERVGLSLAVADAHPRVKTAAHWISRHRGGDGAIREAADLLLAVQSRSAGAGRRSRRS